MRGPQGLLSTALPSPGCDTREEKGEPVGLWAPPPPRSGGSCCSAHLCWDPMEPSSQAKNGTESTSACQVCFHVAYVLKKQRSTQKTLTCN